MERTRDGYKLASGREVDANMGLLSIAVHATHPSGPQWEIGTGYDDTISVYHDGWTDAERAEVADHMIRLWQEFRRSATP